MDSRQFTYPVDEQAFEGPGINGYKLTLKKQGKEVCVYSFEEAIASGITAFFPDGEGSIYKPVRLVDGSMAKAHVFGSMALMVELGWLPVSALGGFKELLYDSYALTGIFPIEGSTKTIQIRFGRQQDLTLLSGEVVKVNDWGASWCQIALSNGTIFKGQPQDLLLAEAVRLGLVDADREKIEKVDRASATLRQALKDYHNTLKKLGGVVRSDGDYEDYRQWYEIPDLPGTWACPDINGFN